MREKYINYSKSRVLINRDHYIKPPSVLVNTRTNPEPIQLIWTNLDEHLADCSNQHRELKALWMGTIKKGGPFSHLFTLSFINAYDDQQAIGAVTFWCAAMNRNICGSRWKINESGLSGIVVAERHSTSHEFRGRLHFHVLIREQPDVISTCNISDEAIESAKSLKDSLGRKMVTDERIDIRPVHEEDGVIDYLVKDIDNKSWGQVGNNIGFWKPGLGFTGFVFTPKTVSELKRMH